MKKILLALRPLFLIMIVIGMFSSAAWAARVTVASDIANIRFGPGKDYEVLWQVEKYHPFVVMKRDGRWIKIKDYEGDVAWLHDSLIGKGLKGVITHKSKCNVRSKPSTKGRILFTVEKGVPFKVVKKQGDWLKIQHADGESGWIFRKLVW
ncbi:MAG: SH3 domain-containing protein [Desulfobacterales bacterium]|nr:SH3 domain-containing protein [Desulfobacterales bacterium]